MKRIIISIITLLVIAGGIWAVLPDQQAQEAGHVAPTPAVVVPQIPKKVAEVIIYFSSKQCMYFTYSYTFYYLKTS